MAGHRVLRPPRFDRLVRFERRSTVLGPLNEPSDDWTPLFSDGANYSARGSTEEINAGRLESTDVHEFTVRWSAAANGVTGADRIVMEGEVYPIVSCVPQGRRKYLLFTSRSAGWGRRRSPSRAGASSTRRWATSSARPRSR